PLRPQDDRHRDRQDAGSCGQRQAEELQLDDRVQIAESKRAWRVLAFGAADAVNAHRMTETTLPAAPVLAEKTSRRALVYLGLTVLLVATILAGFAVGRFPVAPGKVLSIIVSRVFPIEPTWSLIEERIVTLVRAPRILLVCFAGAGLAIS